jgi:hypothetical protein
MQLASSGRWALWKWRSQGLICKHARNRGGIAAKKKVGFGPARCGPVRLTLPVIDFLSDPGRPGGVAAQVEPPAGNPPVLVLLKAFAPVKMCTLSF